MSGYRSILVKALNALPENTGAARSAVYQRARNSLNRQLRTNELELPEAQLNTLRMELENSIREVETEAERLELGGGNAEKKWEGNRTTEENSQIPESNPQSTKVNSPSLDVWSTSRSTDAETSTVAKARPELSRNRWTIQDIPGFKEETETKRNLRISSKEKKSRKPFFAWSAVLIVLLYASYSLWDEFVVFLNSVQFNGIEFGSTENESRNPNDSPGSLTISSIEPNAVSEPQADLMSEEEIIDAEFGRIIIENETGLTLDTIDGHVFWSVPNNQASNIRGNPTTASANFRAENIDLNISFQLRTIDATSTSIRVDAIFNYVGETVFSNIEEIQGIIVNSLPESQGDLLTGESVKIADNHYGITLSAKHHACNIVFLVEHEQIGIPIILDNGNRVIVQLEKGEVGQNSFDSINRDWQKKEEAQYSQCSLLYEESGDSTETVVNYFGEAIWFAELNQTVDGKEVTTLKADANFEDQGLKSSISIMPEEDRDLNANYLMEIRFMLSKDFQDKSISKIRGLNMKSEQDSSSRPLFTNATARVFRNYFWVVLSPVPAEEEQNFNLLSQLDWLEIPVEFENGERFVISLDMGVLGREVVNSTIVAWKDN